MAYADYDFYTNVYLGNTIIAEDFPRLSERASEYIYAATNGASDKLTGDKLKALQKATCAVAEVLQDEARLSSRHFSAEATKVSETVGRHSVSYGSPNLSMSETEYLNAKKKDILHLYIGWLFKVRSYKCLHHSCSHTR